MGNSDLASTPSTELHSGYSIFGQYMYMYVVRGTDQGVAQLQLEFFPDFNTL